jgi:proline iminopeptidase
LTGFTGASAGSSLRAADVVAAYARLLEDPDASIRNRAAVNWRHWEDVVLSLEPTAKPLVDRDPPDKDVLAFSRLCAHYFSHAAWLEEGAVIRDAGRLAGIPGVADPRPPGPELPGG